MTVQDGTAVLPVRHALRYAGGIVLIAGCYLAAARLGLSLALVADQVTAVWPPAGIALAVLFLFGSRMWPGVFLGALVANALTDAPLASALGIAAGNTLEAVTGAWILRRAGVQVGLGRVRDVLALVGAAFVSAPVSASIGVVSLCLGGVEPWHAFAELWTVWWVGDVGGDLIVAPVLLVCASRPVLRGSPWRVAEAALLVAVAVTLAGWTFAGSSEIFRSFPQEYVAFPLIIWAALRFGQPLVSPVILIVAALAIWGTIEGAGPFAMPSPDESLLGLVLFLGVVAVTGLVLGATISERDRAEQQRRTEYQSVRVERQRLGLALEAGRMSAWDWEPETGRLAWSQNMGAIHGIEPESAGGQIGAIRQRVHPDDQGRLQEEIDAALAGRRDYEVELRMLRPDGTLYWVNAKGKVLRASAGLPARMIGVTVDVTQRKRLEEEIRRRMDQLADQDRRKDEFLAMLAHELRNPLAPVCTALDLLSLRPNDAAAIERARSVIGRQVRHMVRLIDDLLDLSRVTRGQITLEKQQVCLRAVVDTAVEANRALIDARSQALEVRFADDQIQLEADPVRLAQVVSNLLNNAAKYTEAGGHIWLECEREGDEVTITVRDDGVGMDAQMLRYAFDLFVQGERTLDRSQSGLGIGLTLVRRIAELHGGTVAADSGGPGKGTCFVIRLPVGNVTHAAVSRTDVAPPTPITGRRILVVDDNGDAADSLAALLEFQGHDVRVAYDGPSAVEIAGAFAPDLVLLDIGLPGMDGCEVAKILRTSPVTERALLVAITGYGREEDHERSRGAGFDAHLVKPVDRGALDDLVGAVR